MTDTSYVTVDLGGKDALYTYKTNADIRGGRVWVQTLSGPRPVPVVSVSKKPPSKRPAPDGYRGNVTSSVLRKA